MSLLSFLGLLAGAGFGYLMGSCPTGYLLVKWQKRQDIREFGSGNIGATNVSRVLGRKWAVFTAVFDMSKGGVAVLIVMLLGATNPWIPAFTGLASIIGHDYPVWLNFRGGKGVATAFGVFGCYDFLNPLPAIIGGVVWFAVREKWGYVSLGSMTGLLVAALAMPAFRMDRAYYICALAAVALTVWRHRENIARLLAGTESHRARAADSSS